MRIIEVKVAGTHLTKDSSYAGVQGEANATALRIEFSEEWDGYAKTITWHDAKGEKPTGRILTADLLEDMTASTRIYLTFIPQEALAVRGKCHFAIDGYINGRRGRSVYSELIVKPSGTGADEIINQPTPTQAEQLQGQIDTLLEDMQVEATRAENAADRAEKSAKYIEDVEDDIRDMVENAEAVSIHYPYIDSETGNWMVWDAEAKAYTNTGTSSKGEKGDKGDKGDKGEAGDGSGDMTKDVYDPQGKATDVYKAIDDAVAAAAEECKVMIVTASAYDNDGNGRVLCNTDKTLKEVVDYATAGGIVLAKVPGGKLCPMIYLSVGAVDFAAVNNAESYFFEMNDLGAYMTSTSLMPKTGGIFTGVVKAPTAAAGTNDTQVATTAFVQAALAGFTGGVTQVFHVGTTAPEDTKLLWIDTANGLKYHNGTAWVTVPVAYN